MSASLKCIPTHIPSNLSILIPEYIQQQSDQFGYELNLVGYSLGLKGKKAIVLLCHDYYLKNKLKTI